MPRPQRPLRPEVVDLDQPGGSERLVGGGPARSSGPSRWTRPTRVLAAGVLACGCTGFGEVAKLRADARDARSADIARDGRSLDLTVTGIEAMPSAAITTGGHTEVPVTLTVTSGVPVSLVDADLDDAPPRVLGVRTASPAATVTVPVRWRVLCAEVGQLPGPHLLSLHVRTALATYPATIRLSVPQAAGVERAFRLAASTACATP